MNLPLLKVVGAALMLFWERRARLARALWLPLGGGIVVSLAELRWGPGGPEQRGAVLWALPMFMLTVMLAVRSYRVYLLGGDRDPRPLSWSLRESRFLLAMMGVSFAFAALVFFVGSLVGLLVPDPQRFGKGTLLLMVMLPGAYLASRVLLAFPIIAVEEASAVQALSRAWQLSRGHAVRILLLCVAIPGLIAWLLTRLGSLPGVEPMSAALVWLLMPAELAIAAMVYSVLARAAPDGGAGA